MIEASTATTLVTEAEKLFKVQTASDKDEEESSDEYSEEDSYMYSNELRGNDITNKGEDIHLAVI